MAYDIFHNYGFDKIHDSMTENYDYKDTDDSWKLVKQKEVRDSDGFLTEYSWYTNGDKHIFMFGDSDLYDPDEDYADWVADSEQEACEWFDSYTGFDEDDDVWEELEDEDVDLKFEGNSNFINEGFLRVFSNNKLLED